MSQTKTLTGKVAVLEGLAQHPAVKAVLAWNPQALTDAKFDRDELTLTVATEEICAAAKAVQQAGYNFFEDMTRGRLVPFDATLPVELSPAVALIQGVHPAAGNGGWSRTVD